MRRARKVIASRVASSAQWTSSSTRTVGRRASSSSSISSGWSSCGEAPRAIACSSGTETESPRSRNGPSGRGIVRSSQVPRSTRAVRPGHEMRDQRGLADPGLAGHENHTAATSGRRCLRLCERRERVFTLEQLHRPTIEEQVAAERSVARRAEIGVQCPCAAYVPAVPSDCDVELPRRDGEPGTARPGGRQPQGVPPADGGAEVGASAPAVCPG